MNVTFAEISRMTLFRGFTGEFVSLLDLFFLEKNYPPETHLIEQGQTQNTFYLVVAGEVQVYHTVDQRRITLDSLCAGQFFGEMNLFDPGQATASVVAVTPVQTLEISNERFRFFINSQPALAADFTFQLAETVVKRFRASNHALMDELCRPEAIQQAQQIDRGKLA